MTGVSLVGFGHGNALQKRPARRIRIAICFAVTTLILVTVGLLFNVYVDLEQSGAIALWNNDELHLFIGTSSLGHRVNLFRYPWFLLKNRLGGVEDADDRQGWLEIIAVTASGTQHHVLKVDYREPGMGPDLYTPIDGSIYANDPELGGSADGPVIILSQQPLRNGNDLMGSNT